ncbi:MAG: leucine-rich repeat domain-containing protein, partial [Chloroflexota bacterium]|nr:leucine-rich repeat domain-containing protein [Chloroflexota bacterium]
MARSRGGAGLRRRGLAMALSSLILALGWVTGAGAQTTCLSTDTAVTAVVTDAQDTAGRAALAGDCATLLGLMDTLRGTASLNWANSLSMASWDGITVTGSRVTTLNLPSRQFTGTIPAALNSLTGLQELFLSANQLAGSIPTLSSLTALERLNLSGNELSGEIPDLSGLTSLTDLILHSNRLSGSIPDLSALTHLLHIELYQNQLSGSIPDLSALINLKQIHLLDNQLSGDIPDLSGLTELTNVQFHRNQLSGSIPDLSSSTKLSFLYLHDNRFSGSIDASVFPTSLTRLYLHRNQFSGTFPDLSAHTSLKRLQISDNELSGSIDASDLPTSLNWLFLHGNRLNGSIPDLSANTALQYLTLNRNRFSGSIPDLSALTNLVWLTLSDNQLTGSIPDLSALTALTRLWLHRNQLSGTLPTWWNSLSSLQQLHLVGNPLTGGIPSQLGGLVSLAQLSLCGTDLDASATLPAALETRRTGGQLYVYSCLRIEDASATEGQPLDFAVEYSTYPVRGAAGATALTLSYGTEDGTASSDDYRGTAAGSVTIPANTDSDDSTSSGTISVPTIEDTAVEAAETMRVVLGGVAGVFVWSTATGTILDNDVAPPQTTSVSLSATPNPHVPEGHPVIVTATLSRTMSSDMTIPLVMKAGTAEPTDYGRLESIAVRGGQSTGSGMVTTAKDDDEDDETFTVSLGTLPPGLTKGHPSSVEIVIRDDKAPPITDEDEDGFEDHVERESPNDGDGNCDGIPDAEQSHVVSFPNAKDGRYVTLEVPRQTRLSGVRPLRQPPRGYPPLPPEVTAPISFLGFHLGGVGRGGDVTVSLYLPAGLEINSYWQYGPTRDHGEPHWHPFEYDGETGATFPQDPSRQSRCEGRR